MAHIPPNKLRDKPTDMEGPVPITIEGKSKSIIIEVPPFHLVESSMSIELSSTGGIASVNSKAMELTGENEIPTGRKFTSRITRVVIKEEGMQDIVVTPRDNGKCKVEIFFKHLE